MKEALGVIIGCDAVQEWMLPWWWFHFAAHNSLPVTFIDFGLSEQGKAWARAHGTLIHLATPELFVAGITEVAPSLVAAWESAYTPHFWFFRNSWFKKPLALLKSPYLHTLWIDVDCEIRAPLDPLFVPSTDLALSRESLIAQEFYQEKGLLLPSEISYNSGVIFYKYQADCIVKWAQRALSDNHKFLGDQNLLSRIIFEDQILLHEFPETYNWNRNLGENRQALIYHWTGDWGKTQIRKQITELSQLPFLRACFKKSD